MHLHFTSALAGGHVHSVVRMGTLPGSLPKAGSLVLELEEWQVLVTTLLRGAGTDLSVEITLVSAPLE